MDFARRSNLDSKSIALTDADDNELGWFGRGKADETVQAAVVDVDLGCQCDRPGGVCHPRALRCATAGSGSLFGLSRRDAAFPPRDISVKFRRPARLLL